MNESGYRSDFEVVAAPRNEVEQLRASKLVQANPEAFSGHALADRASLAKVQESQRQEKLLVQAFQIEQIHQAKRMYDFGGVSASGEAWAMAYDKTLEDFDSIADEHNYTNHQRERGREILEELQEIGNKKLNNGASEADLHQEKFLQDEGQAIVPEAMKHVKDYARNYDEGLEQAATFNHRTDATISEFESTSPSVVTTSNLNF